ncbi:MAG: hypothetical protein J2P18_14725 [Nocardia sp.]|nr:hypothetical protein [Nocardia sp.]
MKFGKITATVLMAVAAVGITAGANPAGATPAPAVAHGNATAGTEGGVGYHVTVSPVAKTITTTIDQGRFDLAPGGGAVLLRSASGAVVDSIGLRPDAAGRVHVGQTIAGNGRTLTLTPSMSPGDIAAPRGLNSRDRLIFEIQKNAPGVIGGAIIGGFLGAWIPILDLVLAPAGALAGAMIGGYLMGGQEFLDAVQAFATGRP